LENDLLQQASAKNKEKQMIVLATDGIQAVVGSAPISSTI